MKLFAFKENFRYIAWFFWVIFLINALNYIYKPFIEGVGNIEKPDYADILTLSLIIVALIEVIATVIIRYFALTRPFKKGNYTPHNGPWRFLLVGIINWVCSGAIVLYGTVLYFISGEIWNVVFFGVLGVVLLLFHSPRLSPFKKELHEDPDIEDPDILDAPFKL